MTISKTTIRLMHQNYQFLFGKVLPNSVLSIKKSHACALEFGHNICIFCKLILCFTFAPFLQGYIVICGLINQFMHINQFTLWSQSMKCLRKTSRGWGFSSFSKAWGGVLSSFFARGWGIRPSKTFPDVLPGGDGQAWN